MASTQPSSRSWTGWARFALDAGANHGCGEPGVPFAPFSGPMAPTVGEEGQLLAATASIAAAKRYSGDGPGIPWEDPKSPPFVTFSGALPYTCYDLGLAR